jgi:hypothetical protein
MAAPFRETTVDLYYGVGFDCQADCLEYAINKGVVDGAKGWFKYDGKSLRKTDFTPEMIERIKGELFTLHNKVK